MRKTTWRAGMSALAFLVTGILAVPAAAAVGQPGLRPAVSDHLINVATKKPKSRQTQRQKIDKQLTQSGYKEQIQQWMGQSNYQQMIGGQGLPGQ
jgi:hypothetical protein